MSKDTDFYIGYLKTPSSVKNFYAVLIPILLLLVIGCGFWFVSNQQAVGSGKWNATYKQTLSGFLTVDPYPVLHIKNNGILQSVILVEQGKQSAHELATPFDGQWVDVSGFSISRGDWRMLEVPAIESSITLGDAGTAKPIPAVSLGAVELRGEIIDSKCFLGVMKPGSGKVHRACAAMCLRGGMPPMFVVKDSNGDRYGYLLTQMDGSSASSDLVEYVGVPVKINGELQRRGDILYVSYEASSVSRLSTAELKQYGETFSYY